MRRKICIITGTRAEYGLLQWLMKEIKQDDDLELQIIVTGMHLSFEFGLTYKDIEADGFFINEKIEMLLSSDTPQGITKSVGLGTISFADAYTRLLPDIVVVLGDRFEILAAAQAAMLMKIPLAHIHGGEITEGALDDSIRHAITKMSHIHFAATESYYQRIIQMGEEPSKVYNVGALGVEGMNRINVLNLPQFEESVGMKELQKFFLITLHPTTLGHSSAKEQIDVLLEALNHFQDYKLIFTKTNADENGRIINKTIEEYVALNPHRSSVFISLGQQRYISALKHAAVVVGNSSSGILEAPVFKTPTINIGTRQKGRLKSASIIDCDFIVDDIVQAIQKGISSDMKTSLEGMEALYGGGDTSKRITSILKYIDIEHVSVKRFYDLTV